MVTLKRNLHDPTTGTCEYDLIWKKGLCRCDYVKDLEMVSSWIIQLGLKANDEWRQKGGRHRCGGEGHVETEAENSGGHQELEEVRTDCPLEP